VKGASFFGGPVAFFTIRCSPFSVYRLLLFAVQVLECLRLNAEH
jgi:hypothetical protein